MLAETSTDK